MIASVSSAKIFIDKRNNAELKAVQKSLFVAYCFALSHLVSAYLGNNEFSISGFDIALLAVTMLGVLYFYRGLMMIGNRNYGESVNFVVQPILLLLVWWGLVYL